RVPAGQDRVALKEKAVAIDIDSEGQGAMDHGRRMVEEARAFREAIGNQAESFTRAIDLRGRVERNPLGMMLAAAGIGYVLGGGHWRPSWSRTSGSRG